ncbi:uncharacterized protein PHALS_05115 [Plasmopara halstedii]|uniref:Uncharacterized protein n=1 Tax=Plasmopara halstedii TaxID=4781 RepID=A0A0N7L7R1_PLAHL|nr:uncharacterized protein PHALS_05115 [Plasmopara halstedii]CEG47779.1 hypothetical protein PHALS_05115 [Plasmopara halstedii]|eukprot:XP_024584148.1 hypothetical protein PHALS_05115 [Plasmopara halstedii]
MSRASTSNIALKDNSEGHYNLRSLLLKAALKFTKRERRRAFFTQYAKIYPVLCQRPVQNG